MQAPPNEPRLGFHLSGNVVPVRAFIAAAEKLTDLLGELEASLTGNQGLEWQIADLHNGSAVLALVPSDQSAVGVESAGRVINTALEGLALVEDTAQRPPHFSDQALRQAKSLVNAMGAGNGLAIFGGMEAQRREVQLSRRLVAHVDALVGRPSVAIGALEGRLEAITIHDIIAFSIYDAITNRRIVCRCNRETLNAAMEHFDQRVSVKGEIKYNARGEAESIKVEEVRRLGLGPLPQAEDVRGLLADDKIDGDEWAEYIRDRWCDQ